MRIARWLLPEPVADADTGCGMEASGGARVGALVIQFVVAVCSSRLLEITFHHAAPVGREAVKGTAVDRQSPPTRAARLVVGDGEILTISGVPLYR